MIPLMTNSKATYFLFQICLNSFAYSVFCISFIFPFSNNPGSGEQQNIYVYDAKIKIYNKNSKFNNL